MFVPKKNLIWSFNVKTDKSAKNLNLISLSKTYFRLSTLFSQIKNMILLLIYVLTIFFLPFQLSNWTFHRFQSSGWRWICKWENMSSTSSSLHPMCRSFSAESQKKDWSKRLSLRGNPRSKEVLKKYFHLIFSFSSFFPFSWFQSRDLEPNPRTKSLEKSWVEKSNLISAKCLFTFDNFI